MKLTGREIEELKRAKEKVISAADGIQRMIDNSENELVSKDEIWCIKNHVSNADAIIYNVYFSVYRSQFEVLS